MPNPMKYISTALVIITLTKEEKRWKTHKTNNLYRPTPRKFHTAFYSGTIFHNIDEIKGLIICGGEA